MLFFFSFLLLLSEILCLMVTGSHFAGADRFNDLHPLLLACLQRVKGYKELRQAPVLIRVSGWSLYPSEKVSALLKLGPYI